MSKKSLPILFSKFLYEIGQDLLDIQYYMIYVPDLGTQNTGGLTWLLITLWDRRCVSASIYQLLSNLG